MTIAIGTDIVEIQRIASALERQGDKFVQRILLKAKSQSIRRGVTQWLFWPNGLPLKRPLLKRWALELVAVLAFSI